MSALRMITFYPSAVWKMQYLSLFLIALTALILAGCMSSEQPNMLPPNAHLVAAKAIPTPNQQPRPTTEPFILTWEEDIGIKSFRVVKISGNTVEYVFPVTVPVTPAGKYIWNRSKFDLDDSSITRLRNILDKGGIAQLAEEYDSDVADGTVVRIRLVQKDYEKNVYCDNYFPPIIRELTDFLEQTLKVHNSEASNEEISMDMAKDARISSEGEKGTSLIMVR
jgi:hypothetical protein